MLGPDDNFTKVVGNYIANDAASSMDTLEQKTEEINQLHMETCDFYSIGQHDEIRHKPVELFELWNSFLTVVQNSIPKEAKLMKSKTL